MGVRQVTFDDLVGGTRLAGVVADGDATVVALERNGVTSATLTYGVEEGDGAGDCGDEDGRKHKGGGKGKAGAGGDGGGGGPTKTQLYAQFDLDTVRGIKQLGEILEQVTARLGAGVELHLEVRAENTDGFGDATQRIVSENANNAGALGVEFE